MRDRTESELALAEPRNRVVGGESPIYLGIDPGLVRTGYAIMQRIGGRVEFLEGGIIRSKASETLAARVREIGDGLREVIEEFSPSAAAIEQVFSMGRNPKSALLMAHARGAILFLLADAKIPVVHFGPVQVKKILTGSGRADKTQMQLAVQRELELESIPEPHDVADAAAIAICLAHSVTLAG